MSLVLVIQIVMSISTCTQLWLMGNKSKWGTRIGLPVQALFLFYYIFTHQWGLLPGTLVYTFVVVRNEILWERNIK